MKSKDLSKFIASPARIFATLILMLLVVLAVQAILYGLFSMFEMKKLEQTPAKSKAEDPNWTIANSIKAFLPDGTINLVHTSDKKGSRLSQDHQKIYDVNGKLLWEGDLKDNPYKYLSWAGHPSQSISEKWATQMSVIGLQFSQVFEIPVSLQDRIIEVWRYDPQKQYFVGYKLKGNQIGYIGADGFTKLQPMPLGKFKLCNGWVPKGSFSPTLLWQTDHRLYQIDFENRKIDLLFESSDEDIKSLSLENWNEPAEEKSKDIKIEYRPLICVEVGKQRGKCHLILRDPPQQITVTLPHPIGVANFTATKEAICLKQYIYDANPPVTFEQSPERWSKYWSEYSKKSHKESVELYKVEAGGRLALANHLEWMTQPYNTQIIEEVWPPKGVSNVTAVSPPVYNLAFYWVKHKLQPYETKNVVLQAFVQLVAYWHPYKKILNWTLSAVLMALVLCHGWSRRTSWSKLIFWIILTGLFNLAGFLTYWALNHTPVIKCPVCGKRRGLQRPDCVRCGSHLPAPDRQKFDLILNP